MERSVRSSGSFLGCCFQGSFTYSSSWCRLATPARSSLVLPLPPPGVQLGAISPPQARTSSLPPPFSSGHRLYAIFSRRYSFILSYPAHFIWLIFPPCMHFCMPSSSLRSLIFLQSTLFTPASCLSRLVSHTCAQSLLLFEAITMIPVLYVHPHEICLSVRIPSSCLLHFSLSLTCASDRSSPCLLQGHSQIMLLENHIPPLHAVPLATPPCFLLL